MQLLLLAVGSSLGPGAGAIQYIHDLSVIPRNAGELSRIIAIARVTPAF